MPDLDSLATHYTHGRLLKAIEEGVVKLGKTPDTVAVEDLGPVDEFHIGGRIATEIFLDQLALTPDNHVLDVGCGLGGASRFAAQKYDCRVTGVDLTPEFVETGAALCAWVGLTDRVTSEQGDATATSFADGNFDKAYMLHVGMNIADKAGLSRELYRVLKPGGQLGIYDIMRVGAGDLSYPLPWATAPEDSAVGSPDDYKAALQAAGFAVTAERNRREFALDFLGRLKTAAANAIGAPPLGLHIVMGKTAPVKIGNMAENISNNRIAPVELIAEKPA
ncbi:MAG: methyltransferase domain-containing protein [Alphaproteobacteria bacterium]|nr:methyltransferase domain-containing protein [Alphaproteobacteria bacterium]